MTDKNEKQKFYWSEQGGIGWISDKVILDERLKKFGEFAINELNIGKGMKVLDIGCGTGETSMQISKLLGDQGIVEGLDFSEPMVSWAKENYKNSKNIIFKVEDIQTGVLKKNYYDRAFSRMGVMFFSEPIKAFKNIFKSMKKGGKLAFACFQEPKKNEWYSLTTEIFKKYTEIKDFQSSKTPSPFAFQDDEYIRKILFSSGFVDVKINGQIYEIEWFVNLNPREATEMYLRTSSAMTVDTKNISNSTLETIKNEMIHQYSKFYRDNSIYFSSAVWIVKASKP